MATKLPHANPNKNRSPRRRAREFALQGVYQWLLNQDDAATIAAHLRQAHGFNKADTAHFEELLSGTIRHAATLRASFIPLVDRPIEEMSPIEHAVLLLGAYEFTHLPDIPYRVVINEAVELTKSFGGIDGHKYVNGVLDKLAPTLRTKEVEAIRQSKS